MTDAEFQALSADLLLRTGESLLALVLVWTCAIPFAPFLALVEYTLKLFAALFVFLLLRCLTAAPASVRIAPTVAPDERRTNGRHPNQ